MKAKLDGLLDGSQYYDKNYIDILKDNNGWESELLGTLSNNETIALSIINQYDEIQMYAKDTLGVIDNENIRPSLIQSGDRVYFFDDTQAFIMVDTVFGFYAPVGYTLQVVGLKYTELKAVETTYNNVLSGLDSENVQEAIGELEAKKVDKTSIVDNLTTNDATKVLSAKQGKELNDSKLDKVESTTPTPLIYTKASNGTQAMIGYVASNAPNTMAWRGADGTVKVGNPTAPTDAVNLQTFNSMLDDKADKLETYSKTEIDTMIGDIDAILNSILGV